LISNQNLKKELWIFWFEKEEPPNLKSIITSDLYVDNSSKTTMNNLSFTNNYNTTNNNNNNNKTSITQSALSSNNGLPYESRSMLFKALHNLIEKSLIEKGFTRLGKWFVVPYNLNDKFKLNEFDSATNSNLNNNNNIILSNLTTLASGKSIKIQLNGKNELDNEQQQQQPSLIQSLPSSNESNICSPMSSNPASNNTNKNGKGKSNSKLISNSTVTSSSSQQQVATTTPSIDQFNHVSYSFSFFLHGSSRVCTSVEMKLHKPLRILNTNDLHQLKFRMSQSFSSLSCKQQQQNNKKKTTKFKGLNVILAPYGISARLIGYLSNDSEESKLTCLEWQQFYSLKLYSHLPRILVVGLENNKIKLFYPNSFVFMIVNQKQNQEQKNNNLDNELLLKDYLILNDTSRTSSSESSGDESTSLDDDNDDDDDDDDDDDSTSISDNNDESSNDSMSAIESEEYDESSDENNKENLINKKNKRQKLNTTKKSANLTNNNVQKLTPTKLKSKIKLTKLTRANSLGSGIDLINSTDKKEMDNLELTIDSVARNFGTKLIKSNTNSELITDDLDEDINDFDITEQQQQQQPSSSPLTQIKTELNVPELKSFKSCLSSKSKNNFKQKYKSFSAFSTNALSNNNNNNNNNRNRMITFNKIQTNKPFTSTTTTTSTDKELKKILNKLKSNSDQYLPCLFQSNENEIKKMKNLLKIYLNNKRIQQRINVYSMRQQRRLTLAKKSRAVKKKIQFNKKLNAIKQFRLFVSNYNENIVTNSNSSSRSSSGLNKIYKLKLSKYQKIRNYNRLNNKCVKCKNNGASSNDNLVSPIINRVNFKSSHRSYCCKLCQFEYSTENQILLRHKQFDLLRENLPLSFDLLDKCQLNLTNKFIDSTNTNQRGNSNNNNNTNNIIGNPFKPQNRLNQQMQHLQSQCTCNTILNGEQEIKTPSKSNKSTNKTTAAATTNSVNESSMNQLNNSSIKQEQTLNTNDSAASNEIETDATTIKQPFSNRPMKLEPFSIVKSEPTVNDSITNTITNQQVTLQPQPQTKTNKLNILNLSTQSELFHQRQCYFENHHNNEPVVNVNKTVHLSSKSIKDSFKISSLLANKKININDDFFYGSNENVDLNDDAIDGSGTIKRCECLQSKSNDKKITELEVKNEFDIDLIDNEEDNEDDDFENDNDSSSDDFSKEIEKMEKQMAKTNKLTVSIYV
jgi:hypothetical protein